MKKTVSILWLLSVLGVSVQTNNETTAHSAQGIVVTPKEDEFVEDDDITFECIVNVGYPQNSSVVEFRWTVPDASRFRIQQEDVLARPASSRVKISRAKASDEGTYTCRAIINQTDCENESEEGFVDDEGRIIKDEDDRCAPDDISASAVATLAVPSAGDDPRFAVPLQDGNILCFTVPGKNGDVLSLVSDENMIVNARYVGEPYAMWIGEIGIVLTDRVGSRWHIKVIASNQEVTLNGTIVKNKLSQAGLVIEPVHKDVVRIKQEDKQVGVTVEFISDHLSFYLTDGRGLSSTVHGILGQFYKSSHSVYPNSEAGQGVLLHEGNVSAILQKQSRWPYVRARPESKCWSPIEDHFVTEWKISNYILNDLFQSKPEVIKRRR
ncbi:inter-alpha-trypsin inhibitor heavy chain H5-like [Oscarella lobularis]|uniref:inter-alpha-trypsin inhibitor heavy chain H5-like n=1 Tax=Oscarella lobularis TaxID=121494 RepID=UPI003314342E